MSESKVLIGSIKFYAEDKDFGFILSNNKDYYFQGRCLSESTVVKKGDRVIFQPGRPASDKYKHPLAINIMKEEDYKKQFIIPKKPPSDTLFDRLVNTRFPLGNLIWASFIILMLAILKFT